MSANRLVHGAIAAGFLLATAAGAAGQSPGRPSYVKGNGIVRSCAVDGTNLDSSGDQFYADDPGFVTGPDGSFQSSYSCLGRPQTFHVLASADPGSTALLGYRMVAQARIAVDVEPEFTEARAESGITTPICLESDAVAQPSVTLIARARASRTRLDDCHDELLRESDGVACSSVRGRFSGLGSVGFIDSQGLEYSPGEFADLTESRVSKWTKPMKFDEASAATGGGWLLHTSLSGTLVTKVAHTAAASAFGDFRFYVEGKRSEVTFVACPIPAINLRAPRITGPAVPTPPWFVEAGDAIPEDFTLAISPPTGPITVNQGFDLAVMAATSGAAVTGLSGTIDGQDVTGPLAACLRPTAALSGVAGTVYICRGLSGGLLAGLLGAGAHTISINMSLSDGRTITDSATWTLLQ